MVTLVFFEKPDESVRSNYGNDAQKCSKIYA